MSDTPLSGPQAGIGRSGRVTLWARGVLGKVLPVLVVAAALVAAWYLACIPTKAHQSVLLAGRAGIAVLPATASERRDVGGTRLPCAIRDRPWGRPSVRLVRSCPGRTRWRPSIGTAGSASRSPPRHSLIFHGWITLSAALAGFGVGTALGILVAVGVVHSRVMDMSAMPRAIFIRTIPIIAIAPMISVMLYSIGVQGLLPKVLISSDLSFFPVVVGTVMGVRSPDAMHLDLMRPYGASYTQTLLNLRLPAARSVIFNGLKISTTLTLVGNIVAEFFGSPTLGMGIRVSTSVGRLALDIVWAEIVAAALASSAF